MDVERSWRPNATLQAIFLAIVCTLTLVLAGCHGGSAKAKLGETKPEAEPVAVTTVRPEETSRSEFIQVTGNIAADEDANVASKREGIIWQTFVERGQEVRQGDVLARLDPTDEVNAYDAGVAALREIEVRLGVTTDTEHFDAENQPEVRSARADFELARANFERASRLIREGTINQAEYDQASAQYESARQRYALARHQVAQLFASLNTQKVRVRTLAQAVADTTITAPFDGLVVERYVSPGEWVAKGARVARIVRVNPVRLQLTVPERDASNVAAGQEVEFTVGAFPDRRFVGKVRYISPALSADSRALVVEAEVPNEEFLLKPGFFATARLKLPGVGKAYLVPRAAVRREREVAKVFVIKDGVARERVVRLGDTLGDRVEIIDSLSADDVIAADASKLSDGVRVK